MNRAMSRALFQWQPYAVLARHALVYRRGWKTGLLPPVMAPLVFFVAFGVGLGGHIGKLTWQTVELPYTDYVAPALVAYTVFTTAFFEGLYASYVRMFYQKTWDGMLATQVELEHVLWGEALWAATRATINASIIAAVLAVLHLVGLIAHLQLPYLLVTPAVAFVGGLVFGAAALVFTAIVPGIEHINYPVFLVGIPLGLLSNTYFPVPEEPAALGVLVALNPISHLAEAARALFLTGAWSAHWLGFLLTAGVLLWVSMSAVGRLMPRRVLGR